MKKDYLNYTLVGAFVVGILLLLFYILFRITGHESGMQNYYVIFNKVAGVKEGASVTFSGYKIGQVNGIVPVQQKQGTAYKMILSIKEGWQIPGDSVAKIIMPGVIADKQIDITEGHSSDILKPGDVIPSQASADMMVIMQNIGQQLQDFIPQATGDTTKLLASLNKSAYQLEQLLNEKNQQHVSNMFKNADVASYNLAKLAKSFDRVQEQLDQLLSRSNQLITDNEDDLRQSVIKLRQTMSLVSSKMEPLLYNLDASSRNLNEFSRQIRNHPASLISSQPPADPLEE